MSDRPAALARALRQAGVNALFGVTGSGFSLSLIEAFESGGGTYYAASHEGAAAVMAGAAGRVAGRVGAVVTIKGPGAANLFPGQLSNAYEGWPVIGISEAYASDRGGRAHKLLDQPRVFSSILKGVAALGDPDTLIPQLVSIATAEVPGPVHLDVPGRDEPALHYQTAPARPPAPDVAWFEAVARARRPVVIAGGLAERRGWAPRLAALNLPVFTTVAAKGLIDETLPHAAGVYTGDGGPRSVEQAILPRADAVIGLGLRSAEVLTPRPFGVPTLLVDDAAGCAEGFGALPVGADGLDPLWDSLLASAWGVDELAHARSTLRTHLTRDSWLPASVIEALHASAPGCRLVADTGLFCTAAEHVWMSRTPLDMLASANGRFMGTGLPMAIGAAIGDRSRAVVCVVGDGGLPPGVGELRLILEERLPLLILFMTDGGYGSVAGPAGFAHRSSRATAIRRPDWPALFEAAGVPGVSVRTLDQFERSLSQWDRRSPRFIETRFDSAAYARATEGVR